MDQVVLIVAPHGRDAILAAQILARARVNAEVCADAGALIARLDEGTSAVLVTEEALAGPQTLDQLDVVLRGQPPWSSLPVVILRRERWGEGAPGGPDGLAQRLGRYQGVIFLQRPVPAASLVSVLRAALDGRQRQYQTRDLMEALARLNLGLEAQVIVEQGAREEAESANRAKDRFLAVLSHELRTPLTPVQMALHLIERTRGLPASVYQGVEMIRRNVAVEVQLIGDLLDVSRIVHGKLELHRERLDLHECLRDALEVCREDFTAKDLHVTVKLDAERHRVVGEAARLQQVFWNLLRNAAKFTSAGGAITVRSSNADKEIVVEVADTGCGIPADALPKIFDPFEQGDPSRARVYGGLGLGLAISHAIVASHHGKLTVESPGHGRGATFRVTLAAPGDDPHGT